MGTQGQADTKTPLPNAYARIATAFADPSLNLARVNGSQGINQLYRSYREFTWEKHGRSAELSAFDRETVGLDLLEGETRQDLRVAAIEAQARSLEESDKPGTGNTAKLLRKMGPSVETVAYGYSQVAQNNPSPTPNRVMTEGLMFALVGQTGPDRAAHYQLHKDMASHENWENVDARRTDRHREAFDFCKALDDTTLIETTRATQEAVCQTLDEMAVIDSDDRIKLKALVGAIRKAPKSQVTNLQGKVNEAAGINPEGTSKIPFDHPLMVMTRATSSVLDERMASRNKVASQDAR